MELFIYNQALICIGVIDTFETLIWRRRFFTADDFELYIPLNLENLSLLKEGNIVVHRRETGSLNGVIHTITLTTDSSGKDSITVKGMSLLGYLKYRINWGIINFKGSPVDLMREMVTKNAISPQDEKRIIPNLILGSQLNCADIIIYQNSYGNILEELEAIGKTTGLGCTVVFDGSERKLTFEVVQGIDRSIVQSEYPRVIFSREYDNVLSQEYLQSTKDFKNTFLIAGEGEGDNRLLVSYGDDIGLDRFELFVDARDLQQEVDGKSLTSEEYKQTLLQRGHEKLSEYVKLNTFESQIDTNSNYVYQKDYDLGDIVSVIDRNWGITLNARITEVEEVYEDGKFEVTPTFGHQIPSLLDLINKR